MIILPDDWYERNGVRCPHLRPFKNVEAEVRAAITLLQPGAALPVTWLGGLGAQLALPDWPRRAPQGTALDGALALAREEATWKTP